MKCLFLDRDGTINVEKNYLYKIDEFEFLPGVIEGLNLFKAFEYQFIIITNQSGIARGYYSELDFLKLNNWMFEQFKKENIDILETIYCPHHPQAIIPQYKNDCNCRKPKIGMFEEAIKKYNIDLNASIAVGDKLRDLAVCDYYKNIKGYLLYQDSNNTLESKNNNKYQLTGGIYDLARLIVGDK